MPTATKINPASMSKTEAGLILSRRPLKNRSILTTMKKYSKIDKFFELLGRGIGPYYQLVWQPNKT